METSKRLVIHKTLIHVRTLEVYHIQFYFPNPKDDDVVDTSDFVNSVIHFLYVSINVLFRYLVRYYESEDYLGLVDTIRF